MLQTLLTPAGERLSGTPWPDYPRPQFRRAGWMNLNGLWEFAVTDDGNPPSEFPRKILVPFCPECTLSGIGAHYGEGQTLWYRRRFTLPEGFAKDRVVLHIGAADQLLGAWCSGTPVGRHLGGYESMTFDLTDALRPGENELVLRVRDDLRSTVLPYGKQVIAAGRHVVHAGVGHLADRLAGKPARPRHSRAHHPGGRPGGPAGYRRLHPGGHRHGADAPRGR